MLSYIKQRIALKYIIITSATIAFVFTVLFFWISRQEKQLFLEQVKKQAIILHKQIVLTREWVSDHNYILIKKNEEEDIESFLKNPEIKDAHGIVYTKITPAMLTRQLSDRAVEGNLYSFNLTNIKSMNPKNKPDDFETDAIHKFISGEAKGMTRIEVHDGQKVFRYAAHDLHGIMDCSLAGFSNKFFRLGNHSPNPFFVDLFIHRSGCGINHGPGGIQKGGSLGHLERNALESSNGLTKGFAF